MTRINFKAISGEDLLAMERKAWNGVLEYREFPAPEYKFFDTVRIIGERHRYDKIPAELLKDDVLAARRAYQREREELQYSLDIHKKYQDATMRSDQLRIAVERRRRLRIS